jgi:hypothetical protein
MGPIVDIQVARVGKLLADRKIRLDLTDGARAWLGRVGYDPVYGARPLKRAVQKYLQDPLADAMLRGDMRDGADGAGGRRRGPGPGPPHKPGRQPAACGRCAASGAPIVPAATARRHS